MSFSTARRRSRINARHSGPQSGDLATPAVPGGIPGRLVFTTAATSATIAEDVAGTPFGLKLAPVAPLSSTIPGATITTAGPPASATIDLGASTPRDGDTVTFDFVLPDGSTERVLLTATLRAPTQPGQFQIGATNTATTTNLNASLGSALGKLADGALVAASAIQASGEFFSSAPPLRVVGPPAAATALAPDAVSTVSWYTGESGSDPARGTAIVGVDQDVSVQFGLRANEQAFVSQLQVVAAFVAVTSNTADPNVGSQVEALYDRVVQNLGPQPGAQTIQQVAVELTNAQITMNSASDRQVLAKKIAQTSLNDIEGVNTAELGARLFRRRIRSRRLTRPRRELLGVSILNFLPR